MYSFIPSYLGTFPLYLRYSPQANRIKSKSPYCNQEEASRQEESRAYKGARGKDDIMVLGYRDFNTAEALSQKTSEV